MSILLENSFSQVPGQQSQETVMKLLMTLFIHRVLVILRGLNDPGPRCFWSEQHLEVSGLMVLETKSG